MNGRYRHSIDAKGRLFIPAKLREYLGDVFYATKGPDNCLSVYSADAWQDISERMSALPQSKARNIQRMIFSSAAELELDSQGRALLPQHLREYAFLKKDTIVIGVSNRAEIWDAARWDAMEAESFTAESLQSAMDELGL